jgi:hypothetical protein
MSSSSAQDAYSITLDDTVTLTNYTGCDTITLNSCCYTGSGQSTYTISPSTVTIGTISTAQISAFTTANVGTGTFTWTEPVEWIDKFPEWTRIEDMCKQYPGLAIAFEKFKTTYKLIKDDYDTPKNQRPKP